MIYLYVTWIIKCSSINCFVQEENLAVDLLPLLISLLSELT